MSWKMLHNQKKKQRILTKKRNPLKYIKIYQRSVDKLQPFMIIFLFIHLFIHLFAGKKIYAKIQYSIKENLSTIKSVIIILGIEKDPCKNIEFRRFELNFAASPHLQEFFLFRDDFFCFQVVSKLECKKDYRGKEVLLPLHSVICSAVFDSYSPSKKVTRPFAQLTGFWPHQSHKSQNYASYYQKTRPTSLSRVRSSRLKDKMKKRLEMM